MRKHVQKFADGSAFIYPSNGGEFVLCRHGNGYQAVRIRSFPQADMTKVYPTALRAVSAFLREFY